MTSIWAIFAAAGLAIFVSGLPGLRRIRVVDRVDPYVSQRQGTTRVRPWRRRTPAMDASQRDGQLDSFVWGMGGVALVWFVVLGQVAIGAPVSPIAAGVATTLGFVSGAAARKHWRARKVRRFERSLEAELPVIIDLLAMGVMAGRSIPESIERVAVSLNSEAGSLLRGVVAETKAGSSVTESLALLEDRAPTGSVGRLADSMTTAIERGTPVAPVLRELAQDIRESEFRRLLESGGKRELAMLVPVVFLILPVVVAIALLPGLISLDLLVP